MITDDTRVRELLHATATLMPTDLELADPPWLWPAAGGTPAGSVMAPPSSPPSPLSAPAPSPSVTPMARPRGRTGRRPPPHPYAARSRRSPAGPPCCSSATTRAGVLGWLNRHEIALATSERPFRLVAYDVATRKIRTLVEQEGVRDAILLGAQVASAPGG